MREFERALGFGRRRLVADLKAELGGSHLEKMADVDRGFVNLLAIHEGAVAAFVVAHDPLPIAATDDCMNPRAERIGKRDLAFRAAADSIGSTQLKRVVRSGSVAGSDGQRGMLDRGKSHKRPENEDSRGEAYI